MHSVYFNEDHQQFREGVRAFFQSEVDPEAWEENQKLPRDIWTKMGELGYLGITCPEAYGGSEADFFYAAVFLEELGRVNLGGFAAAVGVQQFVATPQIERFGNQAQKEKYLAGSISGAMVGALAISEPDVGSDVANLRTSARRDGDHYILNGSKNFITNGVDGDFVIVAARTGDEGAGGVSLIIVDQGTPGFSARPLKKLGWHCSDTGELSFEDVRVPVTNLLGKENMGFYYIMECFQLERLIAGVTSVGGSEAVLEMTLEYIRQRNAFGKPVSRFQTVRHRICELSTELESCRQLAYHACWLHQQGAHAVKECSMAKLKATELAKTIADECLQLYGGYGFMEEYPLARIYRDARGGTLAGGTSEIMREILSKIIIDGMEYEAVSKGMKDAAEPTESTEEVDTAPTLHQIFASLPQRYQGGGSGLVHFDLNADGSGAYSINLDQETCTVSEGLVGDPDCLVTVAGADYRDIELGKLAPEAAFMTGKIQVTNIPMMMQFTGFFQRLDSEKKKPELKRPTSPPKQGPLKGIRILDLTRLYPGPLGTQLMAQLGADVIKIENPQNPDYVRNYPPHIDGVSAGYLALNRGKRSMALDLLSDEGKETFLKMVAQADVVIEGFRPGVMAKNDLGYQDLKKINHRIIYVSVTGYGQDGPYAQEVGHDLNYIGYTGLLEATGTKDSGPVMPAAQLADTSGGGYLAVIATLSALWARQQTDKGQHVDLAMLDGSLPLMTLQLAHQWAMDQAPPRGELLLSGGTACYGVYRCKNDGYVALAALEPKFWKAFCEAVDRPQWISRQFDLGQKKDQLAAELQDLFSTKTRDQWAEFATGKPYCLSPILAPGEAANNPQLKHRGMITTDSRGQTAIGVPIKFSATPVSDAVPLAPELGEHTQQILKETGL